MRRDDSLIEGDAQSTAPHLTHTRDTYSGNTYTNRVSIGPRGVEACRERHVAEERIRGTVQGKDLGRHFFRILYNVQNEDM